MNGQLTVKTMKITFLKFLYVYMICCGVHNVDLLYVSILHDGNVFC